MSDRESWDDFLEEGPPSPEELAAAKAFAVRLEGGAEASKRPAGEDEEALLSFARLLQHHAHPPTLEASRRDAMEEALWHHMEATATAKEVEERRASALTESRWTRLWELLRTPKPAWVMAFVLALVVGTTLSRWQYPELHKDTTANRTSVANPMDAMKLPASSDPIKLSAIYGQPSPWLPGQNPFSLTRSSSERLTQVLAHMSQQDLEVSLEEQGSQYLLHSRN